ncbi:MAG: metalloregulator ArsR/SmtB family transcription factor [Actinomycetota bacterium]|nr:metalloregulator ArsR/SmtB family transcription factor [Actinomycetota bacterium]
MDTLQVIAEPRRREILGLVWDGELAASEISGQFDVTFGAISQHLAVLRDSGLVTMRKDGNRRLYKANHEALAPYKEILESMWGATLRGLAEAIETDVVK